MRLLVDTQCWLWMSLAPERFSPRARRIVEDASHTLYLSAASAWEISIKYDLGKLRLPEPPTSFVPSRMAVLNVMPLPIEHGHALRVAGLPPHHRDPFDRLLVAQAEAEGLSILTADPAIRAYDVDVVDAETRAEVDRPMDERDVRFMRAALAQAALARDRGEVPVGAVVVRADQIIGEGYNQPIGTSDPTAHAEILALRAAAAKVGNYRLGGATLYVTIEPCQMCVGAMVHARIARLVYGSTEPKAGAIESAMRAHEHPSLNHRIETTRGVLADDSRAIVQEFFRARRTEQG